MLPQFVLYCCKVSLVLKRQFVLQEGDFINIQCLEDYKIWILSALPLLHFTLFTPYLIMRPIRIIKGEALGLFTGISRVEDSCKRI